MNGSGVSPTVAELLEAAQELIAGLAVPTDAHQQLQVRVLRRVLETVQREIELGPEVDAAHRVMLDRLGCDSDADLCRAIREGEWDGELLGLISLLRQDAEQRLRIDNPRYAAPGKARP